MKTIIVSIENQSVTVNGETCNFYEAGLTDNRDPITLLDDKEETEEVLVDQYEGEEIRVVFE
jgi:hypothetical protein